MATTTEILVGGIEAHIENPYKGCGVCVIETGGELTEQLSAIADHFRNDCNDSVSRVDVVELLDYYVCEYADCLESALSEAQDLMEDAEKCDSLEERLQEVESDKYYYEEQADELQQEVYSLESTNSDLEDRVSELEQEVDSLESEKQELSDRLDDIAAEA